MGEGYYKLKKVCIAKRPAPILPDEAARLLREVKIFTAGSDVDKVIELYRSFFEGVSQSTVELEFYNLEWGDEEAVQLAAVLPSFVRLEGLYLGGNQIGDAGAAALAEACRHLPKLEKLYLAYNEIGDAGMAALAEAIAKEGAFPSLTKINLGVNPASDEAKKAVEEDLEKKKRG